MSKFTKIYHSCFAIIVTMMLMMNNANALYYQSHQSGNWNQTTTWETSATGVGPWTWPAVATPTSADNAITILSSHVVRITASVTADEIVVNAGGDLGTKGAAVLTVNDGGGVDLNIFGTFTDSSTANVTFSPATAKWLMGATGTLIKYTTSASNTWQSAYNGGIANIPATSFWINRHMSGIGPAISTTAGVGGAYYPNLIIENYAAGTWDCGANGSTHFNGSAGAPTIKGSFVIGGASPAGCYVNFLNAQTSVVLTKVQGLFLVQTGHTYRNHGTGTEAQGDVQIDGSLIYASGQVPKFNFTGTNNQSITGSGLFMIYDSQITKSSNDVTLNRPMYIDNSMTFNQGRFFTTQTNILVFDTAATAIIGAPLPSFVHGPCRKLGSALFNFPIGKNTDYKMLGINAGGGRNAFWTENFNNGCVQGCLAAAYTGANGSWTMTNLGPAVQCAAITESNQWFISCAENGNSVGSCGTGCGFNATMHVGSVSTSPSSSVFCPTGDCGAAYDAGGFCGLFSSPPSTITDKRAESPVINLSSKRSVQVTFKYIEFGQGTSDNATFWYYDGTTWSQLTDMPKTLCGDNTCSTGTCGTGAFTQGVWTQFTVALPASANGNPNVKIGFRWVNNDDGTGTDPSFAVDDIQLLEPVTFTAEYFYANPQTVYNNVLVPSLNHISQCEYWYLNKNSGTSTKQITLSWDLLSCGVTSLADLRVARWDSIPVTHIWKDHGNASTTGTVTAGTITSLIASSAFGPYTLASVNAQNPLPVELLGFDAKPQYDRVRVTWATSSEPDNDFFTVEKSTDGKIFTEVTVVPANGNVTSGSNYLEFDLKPYSGYSYYRLKQTDKQGATSFSKIVEVYFGETAASNLLNVFVHDDLLHYNFSERPVGMGVIKIFNVMGKLVYSNQNPLYDRNTIDVSNLDNGIYFLSIENNGNVFEGKFLKM